MGVVVLHVVLGERQGQARPYVRRNFHGQFVAPYWASYAQLFAFSLLW
jgi:hypothetical protein